MKAIEIREAMDATPTIGELMTHRVLSVEEDVAVEQVIELVLRENARAIPVVDERQVPIGMVTRTDLLRARRGGMTVAEIMTPFAFSLPASATIGQAAALMACEGVHQVPVVSDRERLIGMVESLELLGWLARQEGYLSR